MGEETRLTSADSSQTRLLEAGLRMLARGDRRILERGFTAKDVAAEAGLSRRTFYDQFETVGVYVEGLLDHAAADRFSAVAEVHVEADLRQAEGDVLSGLRASVEAAMRGAISSSSWRAAQMLGPFIGAQAAVTTSPLVDATVDLMASMGYRARPPQTDGGLRAVLAAVFEGTAARQSADARDAFLILLAVLSADALDVRDRESVVGGLFEPVSQRWYEQQHPVSLTNLRALIVDAAAEVFAERGFIEAGMDDIGRRVGLGPATIERYVGSKRDLGNELIDRSLPGLGAAIDHDLENDPFRAFELHLGRLVDMFVADRSLVEVVLAGALDAETEDSLGPPVGVWGLLNLGGRAHAARQAVGADDLRFSRLATASIAASVALDGSAGGARLLEVIADR